MNKACFILFLAVFAYIITLFFTIPYLNGQLHLGADSGFHMNRIVSLATAIENNDPYPYLNWFQNYNFGYPTPIFYSNLMLYLPTSWLMEGQPIVLVYKQFISLLLFLSTFFMGLAAYKISHHKYAALLTMTVFQLNTHAITDVLRRGGLGELLALVFIPLILIGIYEVIYTNYKHWFVLAIGFCGLVLSHNISFILMVFLFGIFCLINFKKLFKEKRRMVSIGLAALCAFMCALFFIAPMLEQMNALDLVVEHNHASEGALQGTTLQELFNFDTSTNIYLNGSCGPFLLLLPLSVFLIKQKQANKMIFHCLILGYATYFLMLDLFPWKYLYFLSFIQFTQRLLPIAIALLALASGYYVERVFHKFKDKKIRFKYQLAMLSIVFAITLPMLIINYQQIKGYDDDLTVEQIQENNFDSSIENASYNVQQLSSGDYLPYDVLVDYKDYREYVKWDVSLNKSEIVTDQAINIDNNLIDNQTYGHYYFTVSNNIHENNRVVVPRTYYLGYLVDVYDGDTFIETIKPNQDSETGLVSFALKQSETPLKYDVYYQTTPIQETSLLISTISFWASFAIYLASRLIYFVVENPKCIAQIIVKLRKDKA